MGYGYPSLLFAASIGIRLQPLQNINLCSCVPPSIPPHPSLPLFPRTNLSGVKVRPSQQVLQVKVPLGLLLLQFDHGVCLPKERPGGTELSQLNKLQDDLCTAQRSHDWF